MVTKPHAKRAVWAEAFLKRHKEPTRADLRRRQRAFKRALAIREKLDIRPLTTQDLVRKLRDEGHG